MADDIFSELRAPGFDKSKTLPRAMWCAALREFGHERAAEEIESRDVNVKRLVRAAVQKADATIGATTTAGFGAELLQTAVADYFETISPLSAAARLISAGTKLPAPTAAIFFPVSAATPATVGYHSEGAPIVIWQGELSRIMLGPSKSVDIIAVVSREIVKRSAGYQVFEKMLAEKMAATLDSVIFSTAAGDDTTNAGILNGLTAVDVGGGPVSYAISLLVSALATAGGSGQSMLIVSPIVAGVISSILPNLKIPFYASRALPAGRMICLDPLAFASAISEQPVFDVTEQATIHMSSVPLPIVAGNGAVADPTRSTWQSATIAMRATLDLAFTQRGGLVCYCDVNPAVLWV